MNRCKPLRFLLGCAAVCLMLLLHPGDRAFAADVLDDASTGRVIVLLGDSYGAGWTPEGMVPGWIALTKAELSNVRIESYSYGGECYSNIGTGERNVLDCLKIIETWLHDKEAVTDIIFVGGAVDYYLASPQQTFNGLAIFLDHIRRNYPNANVVNGFCAWSSIPYAKEMVRRKYADTYVHFPEYGVYDIPEMVGVLNARDDWFSPSDHGHPTEPGERVIAGTLVNYIRNNILIGGPQANGLLRYRIDGRQYVVKNGIVDKTFNGLYYNSADDTWYYIRRGRLEESYTGLVPYNGRQYYVQNGRLEWGFDGVIFADGVPRMICNSTLSEAYKGPGWYEAGKTWYYFENGEHCTEYTGLAWFSPTDTWMYIENGMFNGDYTGFVYYPYAGASFYVQKGVLYWGFYGFADLDGASYYVENSRLSDRSGFAYPGMDDTWYYLSDGRLMKEYTGLAYFDYNDTWYYFRNGVLSWGVEALVPYNGNTYYVSNSTLTWGIDGDVTVDGRTVHLVNSTVR